MEETSEIVKNIQIFLLILIDLLSSQQVRAILHSITNKTCIRAEVVPVCYKRIGLRFKPCVYRVMMHLGSLESTQEARLSR